MGWVTLGRRLRGTNMSILVLPRCHCCWRKREVFVWTVCWYPLSWTNTLFFSFLLLYSR